MIGLMVWTFFQQSLLAAAESLIDQGALIRKARFPREAIPGASVAVQLVTFAALLVLIAPLTLAIRGTLSAGAAAAAGAGRRAVLLRARLRADRGGAPRLLPRRGPDPHRRAAAVVLPHPDLLQPERRSASSAHHRSSATLLGWVNPVAPFIETLRSVLYDGDRAGSGAARLRGAGRGGWRCSPAARCSGGWRATWRWSCELAGRRRARSCCATRRARSASAPTRPARSRACCSARAREGRRRCRRCRASTCTSRPARRSGWWGATAPARPRRCGCWPGSCRCSPARSACGGRVVSLLELGRRLQPRLLRPREHLPAGRAVRLRPGRARGSGSSGSSRSRSSASSSTSRSRRTPAGCSCGSASRSPRTSTPTCC